MSIGLRLLGLALAGTVATMLLRTRTAQQDYAVLDLNPSASPADVQQAYRDLVQVWHPDRFLHNPRLQRKAEVKLQAICAAYERLRKR